MKTLTVYAKKGCGACATAKKYLNDLQIPFIEVDISEDDKIRDKLLAEGHKMLPVIYTSDGKQFIQGGWNSMKTMRRDEILERLQK